MCEANFVAAIQTYPSSSKCDTTSHTLTIDLLGEIVYFKGRPSVTLLVNVFIHHSSTCRVLPYATTLPLPRRAEVRLPYRNRQRRELADSAP